MVTLLRFKILSTTCITPRSSPRGSVVVVDAMAAAAPSSGRVTLGNLLGQSSSQNLTRSSSSPVVAVAAEKKHVRRTLRDIFESDCEFATESTDESEPLPTLILERNERAGMDGSQRLGIQGLGSGRSSTSVGHRRSGTTGNRMRRRTAWRPALVSIPE